MKKRNNLIFLLLAVLLTLPAFIGIFHKGFFLSDDGNWMVIRFSAFYEALRSGQFPVRFLPRLNYNYGYPVADFLYPLFMYIAVPVHLLKFNFIDTIKIIFAGSLLASSIFCFLWFRKLFDNLSSFIGSLVYSIFPYHLWDIYKRGSVGEVLALGIVPFILWAIEIQNLPLAGLGYGLLIIAHNSLALLFIPILFIYQLMRSQSGKSLKSLKAIELGLLLSCFFWLPALYDKQFTVFDKTSVSDFINYFVSDLNLFGLVSLVAVIGSLPLLFKKDKKFIYFFLITLFAFFLSIPASKAFWQILPFVNLIQFPFRVLSVIVLSVSYLVAYELSSLKSKFKILAAAVFIALIFISAWGFLFPKNYQYFPDTFYSTNQDSTTVKNEYMPKWVSNVPKSSSPQKVEILSGNGSADNLINKGSKITFSLNSANQNLVQINTVYFPGWGVTVDGNKVPIDYNSNGLIRFNVPAGEHLVILKFAETELRLIVDIISLLGFALIIFLFAKKKFKA